MDSNSNHIDEMKRLSRLAWLTFLILAILIILCGLYICLLLTKHPILWGSIVAGILGCSSAALLSALERKAKGWELANGDQWPQSDRKSDNESLNVDKSERFSMRMMSFFLLRPALGVLAALLIYFGFGNFPESTVEPEISKNYSNLMFWSLLAGFFTKTLFDNMKEVFISIPIGKK